MSITELLLKNPLSLMDTFVFAMGFKSIETFLKMNFGSVRMANNFTALSHAGGGVLLSFIYLNLNKDNYLLYWVKCFGSGYFLYDLDYVAKYTNGNLKYLYMIHHLIGLYMVQKVDEIYKLPEFYFFAELSNILGYIVYWMMKNRNPMLNNMKKLQFIIYALIRVPILGYYTGMTIKKTDNNVLKSLMSIIYLFGLTWSKKLWDKL